MVPYWIVTADARQAHLFSCKHTPGGDLHLDLVRSLQNGHENEHEHRRPSLLGGGERRGGVGHASAGAAPHSVSVGHEVEEEHRRFVREVKGWLHHAERELGVEQVTVFGASKMLGMLREMVGDLSAGVQLREGELTRLTAQELSKHPAVRKVAEASMQRK